MKIIASILMIICLVFPNISSAKKTTNLPRFVTIKTTKANVRTGPGERYQIKWVIVRRNMPVEIIAEYEHWRKIRDIQGDEGWVHKTQLMGRRTATIIGQSSMMYKDETKESVPIAKLEVGVNSNILSCQGSHCKISVSGYEGWVNRANLWGIYSDERL